MKYRKQEADNYLLYDTPVENVFLSEYMKTAPGDYVKVYLLGLMYADLGLDGDDGKIASALSMSAKDVEAAWDYWKELGLCERLRTEDGVITEIVSIKEKLFSKAPSARKSSNAERLSDRKTAALFREIEEITGRLLDAAEPEAVAVWVNDFGIAPEIIKAAYGLCVKNGRSTKYRYVEKILMDWRDKGLDSMEKVEEHLEETDKKYSFYKKVFKMLGFRRNPTEAEKEIMDSWTDRLDLGLEEIREACKKTSGIASPSINYINSILVSAKNKEENGDAEENAKLQRAVEERYEELRRENGRKTQLLREKIYTDVPRLREITDETVSLGIKISRYVLKGNAGKADLAEARKKQQELIEEKKRLLAENGYKESALDPVYTCSECCDTGQLDDGRRCDCYFDRLQEVKNEQRHRG